ncbi:MAG: hypothetical protein JO301_11325 [Chitinophagaceae bacterium]|nr:hypothetical protein [Chitinophagaceae bacterium]
MSYLALFAISAFSIALPGLAALWRIRQWKHPYFPLAVMLWIGLVNETISYLLIRNGRANTVNSNLYTLLEYLLFLWLFARLAAWAPKNLVVASLSGILIWIIDNLLLHSLASYNPLTRVFSSIVIVALSIDEVNHVLFSHPAGRRNRARLLFCCCFFAFFSYQAFISVFDLFPMGVSAEFYKRLYLIMAIFNFIVNLIYTGLILWTLNRSAYTNC